MKMVKLAVALLFTSSLAAADVFVIGKTEVSIVIPDGYCSLDYSLPGDNRVLTSFDRQAKGKHRRLVFMVNCEQLNKWRYGDLLTFSDFGYILVPEESVDEVADETLDVFLNNMISEIGYNRKNVIRHRGKGYLERHIEMVVKELETNTSVDLGLIHRDIFAFYTASLDRVIPEGGLQQLSGNVNAITQVNGKSLLFYWFRELGHLNTIRKIESDLQKWVAFVHEVN